MGRFVDQETSAPTHGPSSLEITHRVVEVDKTGLYLAFVPSTALVERLVDDPLDPLFDSGVPARIGSLDQLKGLDNRADKLVTVLGTLDEDDAVVLADLIAAIGPFQKPLFNPVHGLRVPPVVLRPAIEDDDEDESETWRPTPASA
jgi:hypothetical protein